MTQLFTIEDKVGDIVAAFPKASDFFKSCRIDFCCSGNRPLAEAAAEKNLAAADLAAQLNQLQQDYAASQHSDTDWTKVSSSQLIEHIVQTHHAFLYEELPQLSLYVTRIMHVHGERHEELIQVHALFTELKQALEQHLPKEEEHDFKALLAYEAEPNAENRQAIQAVIADLESEHAQVGAILKTLRQLTADFTTPADGCRTYRMVYDRLAGVEADLFQHIHLENNILFKRVL